jgi:hypothetical protein
MRELSVFVDESGEYGRESKYYLVTLVFHDQAEDVLDIIGRYERSLLLADLPNIPFHASPLMNGHDDYCDMAMATRKRLLASFYVMLQSMPVRYRTLSYVKSAIGDEATLESRLSRDITALLVDGLSYFQSFDRVKIYYDGGQRVVSKALRESFERVLSREAVVFRPAGATEYRLSQVADFICAIELSAIKYVANEQTSTDEKVFGGVGAFKRNYLKKVRRMRLL